MKKQPFIEVKNFWKTNCNGDFELTVLRVFFEKYIYADYNVLSICVLNFDISFYFRKGKND